MPKVFISGPISSNPHFLRDFKEAVEYLKGHGYEVVNPTGLIEIYPFKELSDRRFWLEETIKLLIQCDTIFFLPDWENASGCVLENHIAVELGMTRIIWKKPKPISKPVK